MFEWIKSKGSKNRKDYGSFKFSLKSQPDVIDSSSTISLIAYTNGFGNATIPCVYRWSIIKNGLKIQRPQFKGSTYKCQPSDVGGVIQAQVKSTDLQYGGTAIVQFDHVRIDPYIKNQVEQVLVSGCFSTTVHIIKGIEERECQLKISEQAVSIKHNYSEANFRFNYSINEPETQCLIKNSSSIVVDLKGKSQTEMKNFIGALFDDPFKNIPSSVTKLPAFKDSQIKSQPNILQLKFPTHAARDIFLFVWKGFATNKQLKKSSLTSNRLPQKCILNHQNFDYLLEIQSLKKQLLRMSHTMKTTQIQNIKYTQEISKLKEQIKTIIRNYTIFIEEKFQQKTHYSNNSILSIEEDNLASKRYKNLQNENNHLNSRIYALTKQIDIIRFQPLKTQSVRQSVHQEPLQRLINSTNVNEKFVKSINGSPFSKKKTNDQSQQFVKVLNDFEASRISYLSEISSIHQNAVYGQQIKQNDMQKKQLYKKLQQSYQKISNLEQELCKTREELNIKNQKVSQSAVNFNFNHNNQSMQDISLTHNKTLLENQPKKIALNDIKQIKRNLQGSKIHVRNLNGQFDKVQHNNGDQRSMMRSNSVFQINNDISIIKTEKKEPCFNEQDNSVLSNQIKNQVDTFKLQSFNQQLLREKQFLTKQNQILIQQNKQLTLQLQSLRKSDSHIKKLQTKIQSLQSQIQFYQKNLDVMNRSQQLNIDTNSFNDEQIEILKKQNDFLTNQNEKLSKACQRYMNEAKQSNKLRLQITKMRSRIISQKLY